MAQTYKRGNGRGANKPASLLGAAVIIVAVILGAKYCGKPGAFPFNAKAKASPTAAVATSPAPSAKSGTDSPFEGPGYVLSFGKDFKVGMNSVDDLGLSVVIAVDVSGSMADPPAAGGEEKYVQAGRALSDIVTFLERLAAEKSMKDTVLKVGIMRFNAEVQELFPLSAMDAAAFSRLRAAVSAKGALAPAGKTAIGLVLERGAEILAQSGTIMKSLIVVSDGENTEGTAPQEALWAVNENRNTASTVDAPVLTRGTLVSFVGFDVDSGIYAPVAEQGARVASAANQQQLKKALTDILVADIARLEAAP
jgi:hypothetical protein